MATAHFRGPKQYAVGGDFPLWIRRFEAYARSVKIPVGQLCDSLLALLDDAAFRAFDLLRLSEEDVKDYKKLVAALTRRFASAAGEAELRFQLGQRCQQATETLDEFADALVDLTNRAYPEVDLSMRIGLARDRFIAGVRADHIQERLLQEDPKTLDDARTTAKRLEAARAARKQMQGSKATVYAVEPTNGHGDGGNTVEQPVVAATGRQDGLAEAVRQNTQVLQQLMQQMTAMDLKTTPQKPQGRTNPTRQRSQSCWKCGEVGHYMRNCPSGNEQRSVTRVNRRPPGYYRPPNSTKKIRLAKRYLVLLRREPSTRLGE